MPAKEVEIADACVPARYVQHSFAATNPCHVYDLARALYSLGYLGAFHSGYPRWRLEPPAGFPIKIHSYRTLMTYGLQRLPEWLRPEDARVFRWQDEGFDRLAAVHLSTGDVFHGLPGQCLHCFQRAKSLGMMTVLNHATGPFEVQQALLEDEYGRRGQILRKRDLSNYLQRLQEERKLAERHCVASSIVRKQLIEVGVAPEQITIIPYGADPELFRKRECEPHGSYRICFAGRHSLRKGIRFLLQALERGGSEEWEMHFAGVPLQETEPLFSRYCGRTPVIRYGALSQANLSRFFRSMDLLVLPSLEEGFGLVVVQALSCGIPCIVSDRVGAADLIREGINGSIVPVGDSDALLEAILGWTRCRCTVPDTYSWYRVAAELAIESAAWKQDLGVRT
jgi:glycosyltransferase involved in cell wall biosynthesis